VCCVLFCFVLFCVFCVAFCFVCVEPVSIILQ
jgi:hypothetical protein